MEVKQNMPEWAARIGNKLQQSSQIDATLPDTMRNLLDNLADAEDAGTPGANERRSGRKPSLDQ